MRKINFKKIGLAVALLMSAFTFQSCDSDDDTNWDQVLPNALPPRLPPLMARGLEHSSTIQLPMRRATSILR